MTEQQWDEFFDKLDYVQLSGRWELLPLHWLDPTFPDSAQELERDLVSGFLELRELGDPADKLEKVRELTKEYRNRLGERAISLDAKLCPPGSRVTLKYFNPENVGEGDCLITTGSWDSLGYLVAELAHPGAEHQETVGEEPARMEPGRLKFRHIVLFPDKGSASPRAFRALCEKTLRQARSFGGKQFVLTHLHLPQSGLADRFAAAEIVSAVRQLLRDGPGTTVDILVFSHRNYLDYRHWFESLSSLAGGSPGPSGYEAPESDPSRQEETGEEVSEMVETLRSFAKRSGEMASVATSSVTRWLKGQAEEASPSFAWRELSFEEYQHLAELYLGRGEDNFAELEDGDRDPVALYLWALNQVVLLENKSLEVEGVHRELLLGVREWSGLAEGHAWWRYFGLLERRLSSCLEEAAATTELSLLESAVAWDDRALLSYLKTFQEETETGKTKARLTPVSPGGSRLYPAQEASARQFREDRLP